MISASNMLQNDYTGNGRNAPKIAPAHIHRRNKLCSFLFALVMFIVIPLLMYTSYSFDIQAHVIYRFNSPTPKEHFYDFMNKSISMLGTVTNGTRYSTGWKTILFYTPLFGTKEWFPTPTSGQGSIMEVCNCRIKTCNITYDKALLNTCEAVVFHGRDMPNVELLKRLRTQPGSHRQRWVYFVSESPYNVPNPSPLNHLFNLTMTFKPESDIWLPYGKFVPLGKEDERRDVQRNYAAGKKPGAGWVVSHCGVRERDEYVRRLQNEYPVYVGGGCRHQFKKQMANVKELDQEIRTRFKFYLAFENGFCRYYTTEKYWNRAIDNDVLPIVMGGGPYNEGQYGAIPGSFINVEWFKSVKEMADYLHYLDKNDTAYNEYFSWKQQYKKYKQPYDTWPFPCSFLCKLCGIVHDVDYPVKSYDLNDFYGIAKNCEGREKTVKTILGL